MTYQIYLSKHFKKQLKPYLKKDKDLLKEVVQQVKNFDKKQSVALGANTYKLRVSSPNMKKGERGSFRMIILLVEIDKIIAPIAFYAKANTDSISKKEIIKYANQTIEELKNL